MFGRKMEDMLMGRITQERPPRCASHEGRGSAEGKPRIVWLEVLDEKSAV
jgi:hypothetical protein